MGQAHSPPPILHPAPALAPARFGGLGADRWDRDGAASSASTVRTSSGRSSSASSSAPSSSLSPSSAGSAAFGGGGRDGSGRGARTAELRPAACREERLAAAARGLAAWPGGGPRGAAGRWNGGSSWTPPSFSYWRAFPCEFLMDNFLFLSWFF